MYQLFFILHLFIGATLSGIGVTGVLLAGMGNGRVLLAAVLLGFVAAFPVAHAIAKRLSDK